MAESSFWRVVVAAALLSWASTALTLGQPGVQDPRPADRGLPSLRVFVPAPAEAGPQNFDVARDTAGVLYFANSNGLLSFDGAWWRLVPIGQSKTAWAVGANAAGSIAVGGFDEIGLLAKDANNHLSFQSLRHLLPPEIGHFGQVLDIEGTPQGFLFLSSHFLAEWDGKALRVLRRLDDQRPYSRIFAVGREIYFWSRQEGLLLLREGLFSRVPGGEIYAQRRIDTLVEAEAGLLVSVRGEGFFLLRNGVSTPFAPEASRWAQENRNFCGMRLVDGRWVFGSLVGGLLILRPDGSIEQVIDGDVGLPNDFVTGLAMDRDGALWLALDQDMVRIEITSPISVFDRRAGVDSGAHTLLRHRGRLVVGTAEGLLFEERDSAGRLRFRRDTRAPVAIWGLLPLGDDLLMASAFGVFLRHADGRIEGIPGTDQETALALAPSPSDPERIWVASASGLMALRRQAGKITVEAKVAGAPLEVEAVFEREGWVWCNSGEGVTSALRLPFDPAAPEWRAIGAEVAVFDSSEGILALREGRVHRVVPPEMKLVEHRLTASSLAASFLVEDYEGNLWLNTQPASFVAKGSHEVRTFFVPGARAVTHLWPEPDGTIWLVAPSGLHRLASRRLDEIDPLPAPAIASIRAGEREIFGGSPNAPPPFLELDPNARRLRIELSPLSFRSDLRYQTRLDPLDDSWSVPTAEPATEQLTRLPPGDYRFRVRTVSGQQLSPETAWEFRVRTPWYRTLWALAGALALLVVVFRSYAALRSRALRVRAARLEKLVDEKTAALRQSVEALEKTQSDLKKANAQLEEQSLRDPLTGVANRRPLLPALEKEWARALRQRSSLAFLLLDLDHFKALNDSRGHREGDRCLQAVAAYLKEQIHRGGDLLVRYGGEEFGVLLPETDLDGAARLAEKLRTGIEALGLPHVAAPAGHVTASFGVAAWRPDADQRPEGLIEAADLALYRAKTTGRNRVCATAAPVGSRGFDLLER